MVESGLQKNGKEEWQRRETNVHDRDFNDFTIGVGTAENPAPNGLSDVYNGTTLP
jgi:hypothetical protein